MRMFKAVGQARTRRHFGTKRPGLAPANRSRLQVERLEDRVLLSDDLTPALLSAGALVGPPSQSLLSLVQAPADGPAPAADHATVLPDSAYASQWYQQFLTPAGGTTASAAAGDQSASGVAGSGGMGGANSALPPVGVPGGMGAGQNDDAEAQLAANQARANGAPNAQSTPGEQLVSAPGDTLTADDLSPGNPDPLPGFTQDGIQPLGVTVTGNTLVNDPTLDGATAGFTQSETTNLAFGNTVLVAYNNSRVFTGFSPTAHFTGYSISTDGGQTFTDKGALPASAFGDAGDPSLARDATSGNVYLSALSFSSYFGSPALSFFTSTDGGNTFGAPVNSAPGFAPGDVMDKDWLAVDNFAGAGQGTIYQSFNDFTNYGGVGIYLTQSTDGGKTWGPSGGTLIATGNVEGSFVAVGKDHSVYVFYWDGNQFPERLEVRRSTDGGQTFGPNVVVATLKTFGADGSLGLNFRTNAFPHVAVNPASGALYVAYNDRTTTGDRGNIYFTQSLDGGQTWSSSVQVNDDATKHDQYQPVLTVNGNGSQVFLGWYDRRLDPSNRLIDFYGAIGTVNPNTGAVAFAPNFRISNQSFPESFNHDRTIASGYMGDYDTAAALGTSFYATWGDNRLLNHTGAFNEPDVRFARVDTGLVVVGSTPANGTTVATAPTTFTISLSDPIDPTSVMAADLTVDDVAATSVSANASDTVLTFTFAASPVTQKGLHHIAIAAGAFTRKSDGALSEPFSAAFRFDPSPIHVVGQSPADGSYLRSGLTSLTLTFSEAFDPNSISASSLVLSQGKVTGVTVSADDLSATYAISGVGEGPVKVSLAAGVVTDAYGDPSQTSFSTSFTVDLARQAYPTPLKGQAPAGGLVYDPSVNDTVFYAGDSHGYTITLTPNQTVSVVVSPSAQLQATVTLLAPDGVTVLGSATAAAAGAPAVLQAVPATAGGTYTVVVSGANSTTGTYAAQLYLNAAVQTESNGGAPGSDDTLAGAQDLSASFINIGFGASRGAVVGTVPGGVAAGDVLVNERKDRFGDPGGSVGLFDNNGHLIKTITNSALQKGVISGVELGPDNTLYVGVDTSNGGFGGLGNGGELVHLDLNGNLLGVVHLPSDSANFFYYPFGFEVAPDGTFWVPQSNAGRVVHTDSAGNLLKSYVVGGHPEDLAVRADGQVFIAQTSLGYVQRLDPASGSTAFFASVSVPYGMAFAASGGTGDLTVSGFYSGVYYFNTATGHQDKFIPAFAANKGEADPAGNTFVVSFGFGSLRKFNAGGGQVFNIGLSGPPTQLAVVGVDQPAPPPPDTTDYYKFTLAQGQSVSLALADLSGGKADIQLQDATGATLALGAVLSDGVNEAINNFVAPAAGTYYVRITGSGVKYDLVVTRGADFDTHANGQRGQAQSLDGATTVLGAVVKTAALYSLEWEPNLPLLAHATDPQTGSFQNTINVNAGFVTNPFGENLAYDGTTLYYNDGPFFGDNKIYKLDPASGAVLGSITPQEPYYLFGIAFYNGTLWGTDSYNLYEFDVNTGAVIKQFNAVLDGNATGLAADPDRGVLWAVSQFHRIFEIDPTTGQVIKSAADSPLYYEQDLAYANGQLFVSEVAGFGVDTISVYDANTLQLVKRLPETGVPYFIGGLGGDGLGGFSKDWYHFNASAGDKLVLTTATPSEGGGEFENTLLPQLDLYDANGNLVASNAGQPANTAVTWTALAAGTYYARVSGQNKTIGEYVLNVQGATGAPTPFTVAATNPPANAERLSLSQVTVTFSAPVLQTSLADGDFTIDGNAATAFQVVNDHTVIFSFAPLPVGKVIHQAHNIVISGVKNLQGGSLQTDAFTVYLTNTPPAVVSSSVAAGSTLPAGNLTEVITFNEAINQSLVQASAFTLAGQYENQTYAPASFTFDSTGTVLTLKYAGLPDDAYTLTLAAASFRNAVGQALVGNYTLAFHLDTTSVQSFPTLQAVSPAGSLVYDPQATDVILTAGETKTFTLALNQGETLSLVVSSGGALQPSVTLLDPSNNTVASATASAPGGSAFLQLVPISATGTYSIQVSGSGGTLGLFAVQVTLNAALESEEHGGPTNDTIATASGDLTASMLNLGNGISRGVVLGSFHPGLASGDVFVVSRNPGNPFAGGQILHLDANGNVVGAITNPALSAGTLSGVHLGAHNDLYVAVNVNGDGVHGELLHLSDDGTLLGMVPLPDDDGSQGVLYPFGFAIAPDGTFWVPRPNIGDILHLSATGTVLADFFVGGLPIADAVGPDGNVYFVDGFNGYLIRLNTSTGFVNYLAYAGYPSGLNFNPDGTLWTTPYFGLEKFNTSGQPLQVIYDFNGTVVPDQDPSGDVWASEFFSQSATKFSPSGATLTSTGTQGYPIGLAVAGVDATITPVAYDTVDYYKLTLAQGQSATITVNGNAALELDDGAGHTLALGALGAANVNSWISNFVAPAAGTYYVKVSGSGNATYQLVVTTNATFDVEHNDNPSQAQDLTATQGPGSGGAVGIIASEGTVTPGAGFDGLHFTDTSCGCLPPDNATAVGDGYVVEAVNTALRISDLQGHNLLTEELGKFFGQGSGGDPEVVFDDTAQRWYIESFTGNFGGLELAVSKDANPLDGFEPTIVFSNFGGGTPDFAKVGYNHDAIVIMADVYGPNQVQYLAIDKDQLLNHNNLVSYQYGLNNFNTDFDAEPARMHGDTTVGGPMYLVEEGSTPNTIRVVKLTNELSNSPVFTPVNFAVDPYGEPPAATQPGGSPIATNSSMIVSVDWRNGVLAAAHNVSVPTDGFSTARARWYEFSADAAGANPVTLLDQGTVDQGAGVSEFMPAVALDANGNLGLDWIESSPSEFMSVYVAAHAVGSDPGSNTPPVRVQAGADALVYSFRSGDYGSLVVDPAHPNTFWASNEYSPPNSFSDIWATNIASFTVQPPRDQDWYSVGASAGDKLTASIQHPFSGTGQFTDTLNPSLALYDPSGSVLLAGGDGTTSLSYTVPAGGAGTYYVKVYSADGSKGEYMLSVQGATGALPAFKAMATKPGPADLEQPPSAITVDFNHSILLSSLSAGALTVTDSGNVLSATGFKVDNDHEVTWSLPALPQYGDDVDHLIHIAAGTILDVSGKSVDDFTTHIFTDNKPPSVVASSISANQVLQAGNLTETLTFSEPLKTALVSGPDFRLKGNLRGASYSPSSFSFDPTGTILTLNYTGLPDDNYSLSLVAPGFQDRVGLALNPGFSLAFMLDVDFSGPAAYPTPVQPVQPPGSTIYNQSVTNAVNYAGDTDTYTLAVNAGETITVLVTAAGLKGTVSVTDPNGNVIGSATAAAAGANALLQTVLAQQTGTYKITVGDAAGAVGLYTAQVTLNSALQAKQYVGGSDNTPATAQALSGSSMALGTRGADRLAVAGQFNVTPDLYSFHLAAGQSVSAALALAALPANSFPTAANYFAYGPSSVVYADLNGDGLPDMVVAEAFNSDIYVRFNNGNGTFGAPDYIARGLFRGLEQLAVGDVGNGHSDIVFTQFYGAFAGASVGVLLNDGTGHFGAPIYSFVGYNSDGLALAHLQGPAKPLDVAVTDVYGNRVNIGIGDGAGHFALTHSYATGTNPVQVVAGDLNGDGAPDLVTANYFGGRNNTGNVTVLLNNGDGTFGHVTSYLTAPDYTYGVALVQLTAGGPLAIANTNYFSGNVSVLPGKGDGTFGPTAYYAVGRGDYAITAGDLNADGIQDLAVTNIIANNVAILYGNGGTFAKPITVATGSYPESVAIADLNGDGVNDLSTGNLFGFSVSVFLNVFSRAHVELLDANGNVVAGGVDGTTNISESLSNYIAPVDGTYYAEVYGVGRNRNYSLVVTRGATFEREPNDSASQAQDVTPTTGVLGAVINASGVAADTAFDGLHFRDTSCGCLPPDNGMAVGDGYVVEAVNTAIRISDMQGHHLLTEELSQFFAPLGQGSGGDPEVVFDDIAQRWYVESFTGSFGALEFAVSNDANPLDGFSKQIVFNNFSGGEPDFAKVGYNHDAIVIMADVFGPNQVQYLAIDKNQLINNGTFVYYQYGLNNFGSDFDAEPARMHGDTVSGGPMYLVEEGSRNAIRVLKLTNVLSNSPVFTPVDLAVSAYGEPPAATQPGGRIATNSSMIVSVDWRNGVLAAAHNVSVPTDGFSTARARWYEFSADAAGANPVTLLDQGTVDQGAGVNEFMPAVALDANGNLGLDWIESSPKEFMSDYFAVHLAGGAPGSNTTPVVGWAGAGTLRVSFRSGDYGSLVVDPSNPTEFWGSNEYSPPNSGSDIWATSLFSFHTFFLPDHDWYQVTLPAYYVLRATTSLPGAGPGQYTNNLAPGLALYDASGHLLASGATLADGRNEQLGFAAPAAGTYYLEVFGQNNSQGEYYVNLASAGFVLLDPTGQAAVLDSGNGSITVAAGNAVVVDSSNPAAVTLSGNGNLVAGELDVTGGTSVTGNGAIQAAVFTGVPALADPLAGLPVPPPPAQTFGAVNYSGKAPLTLQPGTYVGGIHVSGSGPVTLASGIYYLQGGGLSVSGHGSITGTGVLIYNAAQGGGDAISVTGQGSLNLTAMSGGTYQDVAIFQDRNSAASVSVSGQGGLTLTGTLYAAGALVSVSGNGTLNVYGPNARVVSYDLKVSGNGVADPEPFVPVLAGPALSAPANAGAPAVQLAPAAATAPLPGQAAAVPVNGAALSSVTAGVARLEFTAVDALMSKNDPAALVPAAAVSAAAVLPNLPAGLGLPLAASAARPLPSAAGGSREVRPEMPLSPAGPPVDSRSPVTPVETPWIGDEADPVEAALSAWGDPAGATWDGHACDAFFSRSDWLSNRRNGMRERAEGDTGALDSAGVGTVLAALAGGYLIRPADDEEKEERRPSRKLRP